MVGGTIVPWVASENADGLALALKWIDSPKENIAVSGWKTLGPIATITPDDRLPLKKFSALLDRTARTIFSSPDDVHLALKGFIIAVGAHVAPLGGPAIATARKIGTVEADIRDTARKIPKAESYFLKDRRGTPVVPMRKTVRC
jgi:hypothetical protein